MGYKLLGYVVWNGGKWYARRRYGSIASPRNLAAGGVVVAAVVGLALSRDRLTKKTRTV